MTRSYVQSECVQWVLPPVRWERPQTCLNTGFVTAELSTILLDAITDKDPLVQEQVCSALCALGESQPEEALRACEEHLRLHEKVWAGQSCPSGAGPVGPGVGPAGQGLRAWG